MKNNIIEDLKIKNNNGYKTREDSFQKQYPKYYLLIKTINFTENWYEKLYCFLNNINEKPKCKICNELVNFNRYTKGYYSYCSIKCRNNDSSLKMFGDVNPMKNKSVVDKVKQTKKIRYGDENYVNVDKVKQTKKIRYGDENYNNREKSIMTSQKKHGVDNYTNREKAKKTSLLKYNDEYYNNQKKAIETNLNEFGVEYYMMSDEFKEKSNNTNLEKYGVSSYVKTLDYKQKMYNKTKINYAEKLSISLDDINYDGHVVEISNYCSEHKSFEINKYLLKNRILYGVENVCTICNPISEQSSIKENELKLFIFSLNINFIENDRIILNGKEIDIYLPDYKLGIEFDGLYWHSDKFIIDDYHINKSEECKKKGIQLLHIFEDEWIYKKEIVKSIIRGKLGIINTKIYGRKTEIREINDNKLVRNFLESNHIQGFVGSNVKIGLFYNNELVSLMTFGKKRLSMGNKINFDGEYEMLRFCNKLNTTVIGGASKIFKHFIKTYNPKSILTFADRRYSNGNLYNKLNFKFIGNTKPNYWYFKAHEYIRYYRFNFRKDILVKEGFNENKSEREIMVERKYYRIYDCGNLKYSIIF
jgi:hypothetical protein